MLMVSPSALRHDDRGENREWDRERDDERAAPAAQEQQDHQAVRPAAMMASRITPLIAARTKIDWSESGWIFRSGGSVWTIFGRVA